MKKWRCTICGQTFEGDVPPVPCPVCGAGEEAFEEVAEQDCTNNKSPVRMRGAFCVAEEFIYGRVQPSANKAARA